MIRLSAHLENQVGDRLRIGISAEIPAAPYQLFCRVGRPEWCGKRTGLELHTGKVDRESLAGGEQQLQAGGVSVAWHLSAHLRHIERQSISHLVGREGKGSRIVEHIVGRTAIAKDLSEIGIYIEWSGICPGIETEGEALPFGAHFPPPGRSGAFAAPR